MTSTHIRIPIEVKVRLDTYTHDNESIGATINRLINYYERAGIVNEDINAMVNSPSPSVNNEVNKRLTDHLQRLEELKTRIIVLETSSKLEGDHISVLDCRIRTLEGRISVPANIDTSDDKENIRTTTQISNVVLTREAPVGEPLPDEEIAPDRVQFLIHDKSVVVNTHQDEREIITTPERERQIAKIKQLKAEGMGVMKIAESVGVAHSQISKVVDSKKYPKSLLKPEAEEKLLSL